MGQARNRLSTARGEKSRKSTRSVLNLDYQYPSCAGFAHSYIAGVMPRFLQFLKYKSHTEGMGRFNFIEECNSLQREVARSDNSTLVCLA